MALGGRVFSVASRFHSAQAGLEAIIDRFEVVSVRNFYQPSLQNMLGERFVEAPLGRQPRHMVCLISRCVLREPCMVYSRLLAVLGTGLQAIRLQ